MFAFAGKVVSDPCLRQKDTRLILNRPFGKGRGKLYFFQVRLEMTQIESSCSPGNRRSLRPLTFPSPVVWNEVQAVLPSPFLLLSPSRPSSRAALWCVCVCGPGRCRWMPLEQTTVEAVLHHCPVH